MFTDIVGYSALMSKDEPLALSVLERNRDISQQALKDHNGEFIKEIGDGTLCIFQSSWDAVMCAVSIQKAIAAEGSYRLRIGIHIGDIVVSENDIFGDSVNIASRIESICEPGGICFTQRVYEDVQNKLDFKVIRLGEKKLKNIAQPVIAYSIPAIYPHLSSQDKKRSALSNKSKIFFILSSILILLAIGYFTLRPLVLKAVMTQNPIPIAVISFENQTGESKFDYLQKAIPNLLITNLEQSNLFRVITWERMQDLLQQMGKNDVKIIDPALGFEICRQEGCNLIVIGSYVKAGETFVTDIKILDVNTKQLIKSASARGTGEESILQLQIDYLSKEISGSAGIPEFRIENRGMHIKDVTTNSIAAYDYFLKGRDAFDKMYFDDAREYLEKAISLDSSFAVAWLYLSNTYGSLQNTQMRNSAIEKANIYSARATEKEQLTIKSVYARIIENNPGEELRILKELSSKYQKEKRIYYALGKWYCDHNRANEAISDLNKALDLDPEYSEALNQIAYQYMKKGMYDEALRNFRRYASLCPKDANPHDSMGDLLWQMGKLDEAIDEYSKALEIKPDFHISAGKIAYIFAIKEEYANAEKWLKKAVEIAPSSGTQAVWLWVQAWMYNWCGQYDKAFASLENTNKLASKEDNQYIIAGINWLTAFMNVNDGRYDLAEINFNQAIQIFLQYSTDHKSDSAAYYLFHASVSIARDKFENAEDNLDQVRRLLPEMDSNSVDFNRYWYECNRVELLIARKDYKAAVEQAALIKLPTIPSFEFPQVLIYNIPFHHDFLARAYLGLGLKDEAIAEYERLITFNPDVADRRLIHPDYHIRLANLYEDKGEITKAAEQERKFKNYHKLD